MIRAALHSEVATVERAVTIHLLVVSGLLLSAGRLGDLRGHKRIYFADFIIFMARAPHCAGQRQRSAR